MTAPDTDAAAEPVESAKRALVLVMDDDDMVRRVASTLLEHLGYEPVSAADGTEALQRTRALLADGKPLAAALVDLTVRSGDGGRDLVAPLRELLPALPIVASSGHSAHPIMAEPSAFGFSASLHKPFKIEDLSDLLTQLIDAGRG
jgi:CheY-like chemotaxis protein